MDSHKNPQNCYNISNIEENKNYFLSKYNNFYEFRLFKSREHLLIKCQKYELFFNHKDLQTLTKSNIYSLDKAYQYITSLFEEKKVTIRKIKEKKYIILICKKIYVYNKETKIELTLDYRDNDKMTFNSNQEKKGEEGIIVNYKEQNKNLENEKNICKTYQKINDAYAYDNLDNTFIVFKSINNQLYLIYATENKSIIIFDIIGNQKINEIKNAHNFYITNFRYYLDTVNNRDLIMSMSNNDNNLKVWDFKYLDCICYIENIYNTGALDSACIFYYNKQNYILTSNDTENDTDKEVDRETESVKVYDFNGNKIGDLKDSNYRTFFIDTYYDTVKNKTYIITGNEGFVQSYDYEKNEKYFRYLEYHNSEKDTKYGHCSIIINSDENMTKMFETSWDGNIRIWNFHLGELIKKIETGCLQGICLSNNNKYLYVGCEHYIKVINLENGNIIESLKTHEYDDNDDTGGKEILTLKRIFHPQYGEMLLSQSCGEDQIKFWLIDKIINA